MELQFTKHENGTYQAHGQVNADFNIHVELAEGSTGTVVVRAGTLSHDNNPVVFSARFQDTFDRDFDAVVYPKYITVTVDEPVIRGVITEST